VLGELESSGMTFDHLWILGLSDKALPRMPAPNPFIPLPVQRRHGMQRAFAEREFRFAEQIARRLLDASPDVVVSWPQMDAGMQQRPSPLIADIPAGQPGFADSSAPDRVIWAGRPELDRLTDSLGPPLSSRKAFSGGTGIIKDQALCPFRAFAHHRLRAEGLDLPEIGIDSMARGTLAHTVLELFWNEVGGQTALLALDEADLRAKIQVAVDSALERLERERRHDLPARQRQIEAGRLVTITRQWLNIEARRGAFQVTDAEKNHRIEVGKLTIRTRIDRIDELADGSAAIIDYKTGRPDPTQWLDERVTEPQLPLYCLGLEHNSVGAVMFAEVRSRGFECGFRGLARETEAWPGAKSRKLDALFIEKGWESLDDVLSHWDKVLPALGDDFARGEAAVDPVGYELACRYCDLTGLCRVLERQNGGHGGDDE
jgi:probable DNA repair protein